MIETPLYHVGQYIGFAVGDRVYLQRCPVCKRENYVSYIPTGICAWCGWKAVPEVTPAPSDIAAPPEPHRTPGHRAP